MFKWDQHAVCGNTRALRRVSRRPAGCSDACEAVTLALPARCGFVAEEDKIMLGILRASGAAIVLWMAATSAQAQDVADFYKAKNVELYIGYSVGGGYDLWARVLARHMGDHIPGNPTIVVKNMEGAGSLRLANWLYRIAPKDGSVFGIIGRGTGFDPLLGNKAAQFDGTKFTWIGSGNHEVSVCVSFEGHGGITTFDDLLTKEMTVGGTGASADTDQFPKVVNGVLGTKMKIVSGYPGGNDIVLAMERGELQGRCGWSWSSVKATHGSWIAEKKLNILVQLSLHKHPELPDVPLIVDLAKSDEDRQILRLIFARQVMGRPFLAPPGIPAERADALRMAFTATMTDPAFMADAEKSQLEVNPVAGDDLQKLVAEIYRTPPEVAKKAAQLLAAK
jgi:tripartite-type tricarboxylate transporter receptor subunit TctC